MLIFIEGMNKDSVSRCRKNVHNRLGIPFCSMNFMPIEYIDLITKTIEVVEDDMLLADPAIVFERYHTLLSYLESIGAPDTVVIGKSHILATVEGKKKFNYDAISTFLKLDKRFAKLGTVIYFINEDEYGYEADSIDYLSVLNKSKCEITVVEDNGIAIDKIIEDLKERLGL